MKSSLRITQFLSCVLLLAISLPAFTQSEVYQLGGADPRILQSLSDKHENVYRQTIAALPAEHKKDLQQLYKVRWENAREKFEKKEIYTGAEASVYLNKVIAEIRSANPSLAALPVNCYFSRSGVPNASYVGEGIILVNMGLFSRLDNESQLAFVICHEVAHQYLRHSDKAITSYVHKLRSKEVQDELRKIRSSQYGKSQPLEALHNTITFNTRRHVRENETEADSLAVALMMNTGFDPAEAVTALKILDNIDSDTISTNNCLQKLFHSSKYPFQQKWIAREEGLLGGHAVLATDEFEDSLKTHPDCELRIKKLEPVIDDLPRDYDLNVIDSVAFQHFTRLFRYEVVEYAYSSGNYARSLYYTLELLQSMPDDPYLISNIGRVLNGLYYAQKEHRLNTYVELPAPAFPSHYNQLLQFIQNLYPENIASINFHFLERHQQSLNNYPPFLEAYRTSIQIAGK